MRKINICHYTFLFLITVVSLFFLTGCESIPPGNPPEGPIVLIQTTSNLPLAPKEAINNMTTAIATCPQLYANDDIPVINLYPVKISDSDKEYESKLNYLTAMLYRNLIEMGIIKLPFFSNAGHADFLLSSTFSKIFNDSPEEENNQPTLFKWEVKLLSPESRSKSIWRRSIKVKIDH